MLEPKEKENNMRSEVRRLLRSFIDLNSFQLHDKIKNYIQTDSAMTMNKT